MKLIIKRDQDKGFFGGISFVLEARVQLTPQEDELVRRYKAHKEVIYTKGDRIYTINDLLNGVRDKCKDITVLLNNEEVYKQYFGHFLERKGLTKKATNWLNGSAQLQITRFMAYDNCHLHSEADAWGPSTTTAVSCCVIYLLRA